MDVKLSLQAPKRAASRVLESPASGKSAPSKAPGAARAPDGIDKAAVPTIPTGNAPTPVRLTLTAAAQDPRVAEIVAYFKERGTAVTVVRNDAHAAPVLDADIAEFAPLPLADGRARLAAGTGDLVLALLKKRDPEGRAPLTHTAKLAAAASLRTPAGELPPLPGVQSFFVFNALNALPSALDQTTAAFGNLGEGFMRTLKNGHGGVRQMCAGLVQLPFTLPALPIAAIESSASFATSGLAQWCSNSSGAMKVLATTALVLALIVLAPVRLCTKIAGIFVRAVSFVGCSLANFVGGAEYQRISVNVQPSALMNPGSNPFWFYRDNARGELCDPETWIAYYQENADSLYGAPMQVVQELRALRETNRKAYDALRAQLADAGIQCFYRFPSLELLQATLKNRTPDPKDARPTALVVAGTADHNGAFQTLSTTLDQLCQGYRLVYVEASTDVELFQAIDTYGAQQPLSALIVAGHGAPSGTNFSTLDMWFNVSEGSLDVKDDEVLKTLAPRLAPNAHVVLESCKTGDDTPQVESMSEMLHRVWPQVSVDAPEWSSRNAGYHLDDKGLIKGSATLWGPIRRIKPSDPVES